MAERERSRQIRRRAGWQTRMACGMTQMLKSTLKINRLFVRRGARATADSFRLRSGQAFDAPSLRSGSLRMTSKS